MITKQQELERSIAHQKLLISLENNLTAETYMKYLIDTAELFGVDISDDTPMRRILDPLHWLSKRKKQCSRIGD